MSKSISFKDIIFLIPDSWSTEKKSVDFTIVYPKSGEKTDTYFSLKYTSLKESSPESFEEKIKKATAQTGAELSDFSTKVAVRFAHKGMPSWLHRYSGFDKKTGEKREKMKLLMVTDLLTGDMIEADASSTENKAEESYCEYKKLIESIRKA